VFEDDFFFGNIIQWKDFSKAIMTVDKNVSIFSTGNQAALPYL